MQLLSVQEVLPVWSSYLIAVLAIFATFLLLQKQKFRNKTTAVTKTKDSVLGVQHIPGPRPVWGSTLIGNVPQLLPLSKIVPAFLKLASEYPKLFKMSGLNMPFVFLICPKAIHQLFKSSDLGHGVKTPLIYGLTKPYMNNGVFVSKNKFWQKQRKILMKTQSLQNLKAYTGMLNRHGKQFVKTLEQIFKDGKSHKINDQINVLFLNIICEMITGNHGIPSDETIRYQHNFKIWEESAVIRMTYPWFLVDLVWNLHPMSRTRRLAIEEMNKFARKEIDKYKKAALTNPHGTKNNDNLTLPEFRSVLDELLDAGVDDEQVLDEVNTMIAGGHETVATVIHFFCLMMGLNPDIQALCQEEVDQLFIDMEDTGNEKISYEDATSGFKYLERCIQETMRLYPPGFIFFRQLETSLTIESDGNSYVLPEQTNVAVCPYATHRNVKDYPNPEKFDPDRFLPENVAQRHSCSFIPFSGGSRSCLASKLAVIEMKVVAAYVLRNFEISTSTRIEDVTMLPYFTLTPDKDFDFKFSKRKLSC